MTQEEKSLLLKDLSARLPYGVKFKAEGDENLQEIHYIRDEEIFTRMYPNLPYWIETIKPYLRPMSSMTKEEKKYIVDKCAFTTMGPIGGNFGLVMPVIAAEWLTDFYNSHHIDYRGLIDKGIAIEVTEENNPYKNDI